MDISFIKDWVIPLGAVVISIWFSSSATNILDSLPQVIEGKTTLAKMQAAEAIIQTIKERTENPQGSVHDHEQTMIALSAQLSMLLESIKSNENVKNLIK